MSGRRRRHDSPLVLAVVGVVALDAAAALALATRLFPVGPAIVPKGLEDAAHGLLIGVGFWVAAGLLGSFRVVRLHGHGVLTFHLPFIVAAMALGGPLAAGIVGLLGTFEWRELREAPWYGVVHNHSVLSLAGVVGGAVLVGIESLLGDAGLDPAASGFLAVLAGTATFALVSVTLVSFSVALRDELTFTEVLRLQVLSYRDTVVAEAVLGWLLALVYVSVGWWAPLVCGVLVIALWRANAALEDSRTDPMTGLLNRRALENELRGLLRRVRAGRGDLGLLYIDMDGLGRLNNRHGHAFGDMLIEAVGRRLPTAVRIGDVAARLGGDEFVVIIRSVDEAEAVSRVAERIHRFLGAAIDGMPWYEPRASIGVLMVDAAVCHLDPADLIGAADQAMYRAKRRGTGIEVAQDADVQAAVRSRADAERDRRVAEAIRRQPATT